MPIPPPRLRRAAVPQCGIVNPHLRTVPPLAARCSVAAHCASLRVLATSALRASDVRKLTRGFPLCPQFAIVVLHLRTVLAFGGPVFRPCGLRFALCPRGSSRFAAFDCALRYRLQFSFAHWTSASPVSATGGGEAPSPLGLLRPVSRTARGLRAPHWLHRLFRPFTFNPQNRLPLSFLADYSAAAEAEGEACAEADASGEASGAGDGEGGAVVPGVSSERISPSCTVML